MNIKDIQLAAAGGLLIGIATSIHYLLKGRVTGFSGIYYSLITVDKASFYWKLSLMSSVAFSSALLCYYYGQNPIIAGASPAFDSLETLSKIGFIGSAMAGFLVGFGTKLGNGCTSGHGVCGLPRFSLRSMVAVASFMGMGVLTATIKSHIIQEIPTPVLNVKGTSLIAAIISGALIIVGNIGQAKIKKLDDGIIATVVGLIFGAGLVVSGMVKRSKIIGFLTLNKDWDPSLMFVMIGAVGLNLITFHLLKKPLMNEKYELPKVSAIDRKLVLGASIFGIGWGLGGLCPGPAIALTPQFTIQIGVVFLSCLAIGQIQANSFSQWMDKQKVQ